MKLLGHLLFEKKCLKLFAVTGTDVRTFRGANRLRDQNNLNRYRLELAIVTFRLDLRAWMRPFPNDRRGTKTLQGVRAWNNVFNWISQKSHISWTNTKIPLSNRDAFRNLQQTWQMMLSCHLPSRRWPWICYICSTTYTKAASWKPKHLIDFWAAHFSRKSNIWTMFAFWAA